MRDNAFTDFGSVMKIRENLQKLEERVLTMGSDWCIIKPHIRNARSVPFFISMKNARSSVVFRQTGSEYGSAYEIGHNYIR